MNIEVKKTKKIVDYMDSMIFLENRVKEVNLGKKKELLWILEHNSVYTAGTSYKMKDILDKKISIIKTSRGGKVTYHGPGQKIIYFVLNLNSRDKDIRKLISKIEDCVIDILKNYKIKSYRDPKNIGIWVKNNKKVEKIAAIGIRVKRWIAYHGFSININNDLKKYEKIVPCGIKDKGITNLKELGVKDFKNIDNIIIKSFLNSFDEQNH